jgi:hypothetical protein
MRTHRCIESINARASIRYDKQYTFLDGNYGWWLRSICNDDEYCAVYLTQCFQKPINFCPFCGEKLDTMNQ